MAKMRTSLRVKGRVKTNSQKKQTTMQRNSRRAAIKSLSDHSSKGTGKYARRSNAPLTSKQAYKLEKRSLINERAGLETKPELIKAAGQALSMNIAPATTSYGATTGTSKIISAINSSNDVNDKNINNLINGGVDQAGRDNDEEIIEDTLPGGFVVR